MPALGSDAVGIEEIFPQLQLHARHLSLVGRIGVLEDAGGTGEEDPGEWVLDVLVEGSDREEL